MAAKWEYLLVVCALLSSVDAVRRGVSEESMPASPKASSLSPTAAGVPEMPRYTDEMPKPVDPKIELLVGKPWRIFYTTASGSPFASMDVEPAFNLFGMLGPRVPKAIISCAPGGACTENKEENPKFGDIKVAAEGVTLTTEEGTWKLKGAGTVGSDACRKALQYVDDVTAKLGKKAPPGMSMLEESMEESMEGSMEESMEELMDGAIEESMATPEAKSKPPPGLRVEIECADWELLKGPPMSSAAKAMFGLAGDDPSPRAQKTGKNNKYNDGIQSMHWILMDAQKAQIMSEGSPVTPEQSSA